MQRLYAVNGIKYFKQISNIDLTGQKWTPFDFGGHFDGNGKTISNVTIDMQTSDHVGFFRKLLTGGELTGIKLEKVDVKGNARVGGLVGTAYTNANISNSYASGSVTGTGSSSTYSYVGGLVGFSEGKIFNSYASGSVIGFGNNVGGLVGFSEGKIFNSYASGSVIGFGNNVGGLVGYSEGEIFNSYASGSVTGTNRVGGLVGLASASISNSYASGSVSGYSSVGGLVGNTTGIISNSYYDSQTINHPDNGIGIPRTTAEMKQGVPTLSTVPRPIYVDWSTSIWNFGDDTDYPTLRK